MKIKFLLGIMAVLFVGIQSWFTYLEFRYPYLGINLEKNQRNEWVIESLDKESGAYQLDVQVGDVVRSVEGEDPERHFTVRKWNVLEQASSFEIVRNGERKVITTGHVNNSRELFTLLFMGELVAIGTALVIYFKIRHSRSATLLSILFLFIGMTFMSVGASVRGDLLGKLVINYFFMAIPITFLHFLVVFFREKGGFAFQSKYFKYLYMMIAPFVLVRLISTSPRTENFFNSLFSKIGVIVFVIGIAGIFFLLSYVYIKYRKEKSDLSAMIQTVWCSLIISFLPVVCLSFVPNLIFGKEWVSSLYTSWFVMIFPMTFAYLIATKQLFDIHIVLRRFLYTTIISAGPSFAISLFLFIVLPNEATISNIALTFVFSLLLFSLILYSLENVTTKLEAVLFPKKYYLRKVLGNISKNAGKISGPRELKEMILADIVNALQVRGGAIALLSSRSVETIPEGDIDVEEVERFIVSGMFEHPRYIFMKIISNEEHSIYLVVTRKKTNSRLGYEEVQWLNLIISYLAVSLENVHLIRKMTLRMEQLMAQIPNEQVAGDVAWFRKLTFELQEKERSRIATDLHDTTLQDLFFLKRRLAALLNKLAVSPEDKRQAENLIDYIEIINTNLRQSCFELHPYLLQEIGLVGTIRKVVEREMPFCAFDIDFKAEGVSAIEELDMDTKRHLFRIFQELLNNAKKHSQASKVQFYLAAKRESLHFIYKDDGVGFEANQTATREIGASGFGMEQLKSRVLHLNGHFELMTGKGRGVGIYITLPGKEGLSA